MSRLETLYERELAFLEEQAENFAKRVGKMASGLLPRSDLNDPHLHRMIEAFAILAGRVHHKVDCEFPELTEALLQIFYPHLLRVVPSMTIAQMEHVPPELCPREGLRIAAGTNLSSQMIGIPALVCQYTTGYPVDLWPLRVARASVEAAPFTFGLQAPSRTAAALRLELECLGANTFADLPIDRLRFFLSGSPQTVAILYELLFNHTRGVVVRSLEKDVKARVSLKPNDILTPVGFERDEGLLPFPIESFVGYRLLTEFLAFPEKFLFVDVGGWKEIREAGFRKRLEMVIFLDRASGACEQGVDAKTFLLGCTPIVNLFAKSAEPLALTHVTPDYRVVPSRHHEAGMEIYSIDSVVGLDPVGRKSIEFQQFFTFAPNETDSVKQAFWYASRRQSPVEDDPGTDVHLTLVDPEFDVRLPPETVLDIQTTCCNREVPGRFQRANDVLFLERRQPSPVSIHCLFAPTPTMRPGLRRAAHWRLLSQSCLEQVSLNEPHGGREALQEILRLCDFSRPGQALANVTGLMIEGIAGLSCRRVTAYRTGKSLGTCRGLEFTLELDEKKYVGVGLYLFASVLERFLGLSARVNAFSQLIAKTKQGEGIIKKWPPRSADRQIL